MYILNICQKFTILIKFRAFAKLNCFLFSPVFYWLLLQQITSAPRVNHFSPQFANSLLSPISLSHPHLCHTLWNIHLLPFRIESAFVVYFVVTFRQSFASSDPRWSLDRTNCAVANLKKRWSPTCLLSKQANISWWKKTVGVWKQTGKSDVVAHKTNPNWENWGKAKPSWAEEKITQI